MEEQFALNEERDARLFAVTETIAGRISSVAASLKYREAIGDRVGEVKSGLAALAGQLNPHKRSEADGVPPEEAFQVEAARLGDLEGTLSIAGQSLQESLHGLAGDLGLADAARGANSGAAALNQCTLVADIESASHAGNELVEVLLAAFKDARDLTVSAQTDGDETWNALEPITGLMGNLTGIIIGMSARIRMISLNAQVQAVHAGAGTGLEVLSAQIRVISEEIGRTVEEISAELESLKADLLTCLEIVMNTRGESAQLESILEERGGREEQALRAFRDRRTAELQKAREIVASVCETSVRLCRSPVLGGRLLVAMGETRAALGAASGPVNEPAIARCNVLPGSVAEAPEARTGTEESTAEPVGHYAD
jgi:hypothetical protein